MSRGSKKALLIAAKILIAAVLLWYIFARKVDAAKMWELMKKADAFWLTLAALLNCSIALLAVWRWILLLRTQGIFARYYPVFWATCAGYFFNSFLLGLTGGDIAKIYYATQLAPEKKVGAGLSVLIDRAVGLLGLLALAGIVVVLFGARFWSIPEARLPLLALAGAVIVAAFCVAAFLKQKALAGALRTDLWLHRLPLQRAVSHLRQINAAYHGDTATLVKTTGISMLIHILSILTVALIGRSLNIQASVVDYFLAMPIINAVTAIPFTPGGVGVREGMFILMFAAVGVRDETAVTAMSVIYFGAIVLTSIVAGIFYALGKPDVMHHERISEIMANEQA